MTIANKRKHASKYCAVLLNLNDEREVAAMYVLEERIFVKY